MKPSYNQMMTRLIYFLAYVAAYQVMIVVLYFCIITPLVAFRALSEFPDHEYTIGVMLAGGVIGFIDWARS